MPLRFHKSIKIAPGFRLNLSKHGIGTSFGMAGFHVASGPKGEKVTESIPGTGVSFYQTKSNSGSGHGNSNAVPLKSAQANIPPKPPRKKKISIWGLIGIIFGGLIVLIFLCAGADSIFHFITTSTPTIVPPTGTEVFIPSLTLSPSETAAVIIITATNVPIQTQTQALAGCDCNIDYNCSDFTSHAQAQACFVACGGSASNNYSGLDGSDHDGIVCESLP